MLSDLKINLTDASKPLRYTGGELGMLNKDPNGKLRFCLAFPDIYEIGMSHLGFRILYTNLNQSEKILCERFFAPWIDAWEKFSSDIMVSMENHYPINKFDVIGFSFQYEMAYTTALQLLNRANIPLKSIDRGENNPIVIAGGCCILNPAPLIDFIDVFFIGEMDSALTHAMERLYEMRDNKESRRKQLEMLDEYPFTYIPSINPSKQAKREVFVNFHNANGTTAPIVPIMPAVQDRVVVEISRGCSNGCRFCQAGIIYRPVREKPLSSIRGSVLEMIKNTGYLEASLLSLDSGDYTQIEPLLGTLSDELNAKEVSLALPSLRAETVNPALLEKTGMVRKGGFTIAPEAGTQRLRDIINKNLSEEEIISAAIYAKQAGYNGAKLYFMCGLPHETDEDILGIAELVKKIRLAVRGGRFFDITVSVSNFVPKPHTPFERFGQNTNEELRRKHYLLKDALYKEKIKLRFHDAATSVIEAALARGDSSLGRILEQAVLTGFYLDAWSECFDRNKWTALFENCGTTQENYACKNFDEQDSLPWHNVDCGITQEWLKHEALQAEKAKTTQDCRKSNCSTCGVCDFKSIMNINAPDESIVTGINETKSVEYKRYELIFKRADVASMMSALDSVRIFSHIMLASGIKLKFTEGFNPQPRIVLPCPLPVGVMGDSELILFEADPKSMSNGIIDRLNKHSISGLSVTSIRESIWAKNLSNFKMVFSFDENSFNFLIDAIKNNRAFYERLDKKNNVKRILLADYLQHIMPEALSMEVLVTSLGGFHFPDFFRKAGYDKHPIIIRKQLTPDV